MTEPSDDELDRAERIRKLRTGGARSRSHEIREQRRAEASEPEDSDDATANDAATDEDVLDDAGRVDAVELAEDLPPGGSLFVLPASRGLRRRFNTVAEQLHLRYGFTYESELDVERHLRPLALYLGVRTLEDADVDVVMELLETVDELDAPGEDGE